MEILIFNSKKILQCQLLVLKIKSAQELQILAPLKIKAVSILNYIKLGLQDHIKKIFQMLESKYEKIAGPWYQVSPWWIKTLKFRIQWPSPQLNIQQIMGLMIHQIVPKEVRLETECMGLPVLLTLLLTAKESLLTVRWAPHRILFNSQNQGLSE